MCFYVCNVYYLIWKWIFLILCIIYTYLGIHPNEAKTWDSEVEFALKELLSNPECVALGQCGLDYSKTFSDPDEQKEVLKKQVSDITFIYYLITHIYICCIVIKKFILLLN